MKHGKSSGRSLLMQEERFFQQNNKKQQKGKKKWMTEEILHLIDERRKFKNNDRDGYRRVKMQIKRKVKEAKEKWLQWLQEEIAEMEELQRNHNGFQLHKKLKELTGNTRQKMIYTMRNSQNQVILGNDEKKMWETYIKSVFYDNRQDKDDNDIMTNEGLEILESEVCNAIRLAKNGKATGPDNIPIEIVKLLDEDNLKDLTAMLNKVYETGTFPQEWLKSTFIPLPKKNNITSCNDFRLISLMSHMLKLLLKIIHNRIYKKGESMISDTQFGFRNGLGTREALFAMNVLLQRCREYQKTMFVCFIDFEKAFDRVQHTNLLKALKTIDLEERDFKLIENLYWNQTAYIHMEDWNTEEIDIKRGVRQGCVLSPLLFNIYSEIIFLKALADKTEGVKVNGLLINNIRYADDTAILAESIEDLQALLESINKECEDMGLKINITKTKFMIISKSPVGHKQLLLNGSPIERVSHFRYLGSWINSDLDPEEEIKTRIEMARQAFLNYKPILCSREFDLSIRVQFVHCYVWSVLLYGVETWTMKAASLKRLEAFEMWVYRRMLKISWMDRITNIEVLRRMGRERNLLNIIKKRKVAYLGHILRNQKYQLLQVILEGKMEGKRGPGRRKAYWMENICKWTNMNIGELVHIAQDREKYDMVVTNLH